MVVADQLIQDSTYVNAQVIQRETIGPGDEVFIAGLFTKHTGKRKNIPIIRIGSIAAMPEEPVYPSWCHPHPMESYLIEARSIGGLSGSPVFVNTGTRAPFLMDGRTPYRGSNVYYLLGLVHGHWSFPLPDIDHESENEPDAGSEKKINSGIAMVVPATKIYETVQHPKLALIRERVLDEETRKLSESAQPD